MKNIIIVGAGGFGRELLQWIKDKNVKEPTWEIKGFIDDDVLALDRYKCDYRVLGTIVSWQPSEDEVFACAIADPYLKEKIVNSLTAKGARFVSVIHPSAQIGEFNKIGDGVIMYPDARITVNARIGNFVTVLGSIIGHDTLVGDFTTICGSCSVNGNVEIGKNVFIGNNVSVAPGKKVGDNAYVGIGSIVVSNIREGSRVFGNPARKIMM